MWIENLNSPKQKGKIEHLGEASERTLSRKEVPRVLSIWLAELSYVNSLFGARREKRERHK